MAITTAFSQPARRRPKLAAVGYLLIFLVGWGAVQFYLSRQAIGERFFEWQTFAAAEADASSADELEALRRRIAELEATQKAAPGKHLDSTDVAPNAAAPEVIYIDDTVETVPTRTAIPATSPTPQGFTPPAQSLVSPGQTTLRYWVELNAIIRHEAAMRRAPPQLSAANAGDYLNARQAAYDYAGTAIRALDTSHVDSEVIALSRDLSTWYLQGASLNSEAGYLLNQSDVKTRQGVQGKSWQGGEKAHRQACESLNRRAAALRPRLAAKYHLAFPPLE